MEINIPEYPKSYYKYIHNGNKNKIIILSDDYFYREFIMKSLVERYNTKEYKEKVIENYQEILFPEYSMYSNVFYFLSCLDISEECKIIPYGKSVFTIPDEVRRYFNYLEKKIYFRELKISSTKELEKMLLETESIIETMKDTMLEIYKDYDRYFVSILLLLFKDKNDKK